MTARVTRRPTRLQLETMVRDIRAGRIKIRGVSRASVLRRLEARLADLPPSTGKPSIAERRQAERERLEAVVQRNLKRNHHKR